MDTPRNTYTNPSAETAASKVARRPSSPALTGVSWSRLIGGSSPLIGWTAPLLSVIGLTASSFCVIGWKRWWRRMWSETPCSACLSDLDNMADARLTRLTSASWTNICEAWGGENKNKMSGLLDARKNYHAIGRRVLRQGNSTSFRQKKCDWRYETNQRVLR